MLDESDKNFATTEEKNSDALKSRINEAMKITKRIFDKMVKEINYSKLFFNNDVVILIAYLHGKYDTQSISFKLRNLCCILKLLNEL